LAFAYTSVSTARRTFATPYVGGSDLYECGDVQSTIYEYGPGAFALPPVSQVQTWGTYGVFCGAGFHNQLLNMQTQTFTSAGQCTGPYSPGYQNGYYLSSYGYAQSCGRNRTYYGVSAAWLLIPFVGEYASTASNGGYPEITSGVYWAS
jgi:hypothetical protein